MSRAAKLLNADPTGIKAKDKTYARGVAAQDCYALFYSSLQHLGRLFCREDWIPGDWICCNEVQGNYLLRLREVPFAYMLVSSLRNGEEPEANQNSEVEFSVRKRKHVVLLFILSVRKRNHVVLLFICQTFCAKNYAANHQFTATRGCVFLSKITL